jgi:hypothetical protein
MPHVARVVLPDSIMKLNPRTGSAVASMAMASVLTGCSAIAGIFKAGVWVGVVAVALVVGLALMAAGLLRH